MINCILIDDDACNVKQVNNYITQLSFISNFEIFNDPLEVFRSQKDKNIHLIFINIQIADFSVQDFIRSFINKPEVIFFATDDQYAVDAYEAGAIDFLRKPFSFQRFLAAVNRVREVIELKKKKRSEDFFFINGAHKIHKLYYRDILYLEGERDYTKIFLKGASSPQLFLYNLKFFEQHLSNNGFIRVHRSYIVPISKVDSVCRKMVTIEGKSIPIGINYRQPVFALFQSMTL